MQKLKIIKELFEKSVEGEAYDLEKYGQYFRPAGVSIPANGSSQTSASASTSVSTPVNGEVVVTKVEAVIAAPAAAAPQPSTDSAKRAEDILKLIRSRQSK
jgi:hypothetical protein